MEAEPFYDEAAPQEWGRLDRHRTEFAVSLRAIHEFLPKPPCAVLWNNDHVKEASRSRNCRLAVMS